MCTYKQVMPHRNKKFKLAIMEKKAKKPRLARIPAWAMSLITLFILFILLIFLEDPKNTGLSNIQIIGYIFCAILIVGACFIICMTHPKSVWYTPVICNAVSIMAIIMYVFTDLAPLSELIFWGSVFVLSVIGAIVGAKIGRRIINQAK